MNVKLLSIFFWLGLTTALTSASCCQGVGRTQVSPTQAQDTIETGLGDSSLANSYRQAVLRHYRLAKLDKSGLDTAVFHQAYTGYLNLRAKAKTTSPILTIVDFNRPSTSNRMWVIDIDRDSLLLHTWSAHGKGSGKEMATTFSNMPGSLQTSLGFYLTAEEYIGKNGRSLKLDGLDSGFNTNARRRYVVMHGADYVSQDTIDAYGHLGNSEGCPAVSHDVNHQIIDWMKGKGVLFITGAAEGYHSRWLDEEAALRYLIAPRD